MRPEKVKEFEKKTTATVESGRTRKATTGSGRRRKRRRRQRSIKTGLTRGRGGRRREEGDDAEEEESKNTKEEVRKISMNHLAKGLYFLHNLRVMMFSEAC